MLPYLYVFGIRIPMYSLMLFVGIVAFVVVSVLLLEKREKTARSDVNQLLLVSAGGLVVMWASALIFNSFFHSIEKGKIVIGGITWLGGVLGGFPATVYFIHKFCPKLRGNALFYFDLLLPGLVLAHAFGRLGCFFGGCCFGGPTDSVFGVIFPKGSAAAHLYPALDGRSLPVLPTQLFEAVFEGLLFIVMIVFYKKLRGRFLETFSFSYGVFRFILEFLRGDDRGANILFLTPSQWMSLILVISAALVLFYKKGYVFKRLAQKAALWREQAQTYISPKQRSQGVQLLMDLKKLKDEGVITEEEFEEKKKEILSKL